MEQYVGLDVSQDGTYVCVVDRDAHSRWQIVRMKFTAKGWPVLYFDRVAIVRCHPVLKMAWLAASLLFPGLDPLACCV
jgi:hypothetical protein